MRNKIVKAVCIGLVSILTIGTLTGCSLTGDNVGKKDFSTTDLTEIKYGEGDISYEESSYGIYSGEPNITELLQNGQYYILHDSYFYPLAIDWRNYQGDVGVGGKPDPEGRTAVFDSTSIVNIPTLFEGDQLFYYSTTGVYDYTILERFMPWGWTIGLAKLESNTTGHVFFKPGATLEEGINNGVISSAEFIPIYDIVNDETKQSNGEFLLDKIGGVKLSEKNLDNGRIFGLEKGKEYDLEIYTGTSYGYYNATASVFFMDSMETYAIYEYESMQDYLYEIKIPEYLLTGYYDVAGLGMMRLVRGSYYNDDTDYSERLLYPYYEVPKDATEEEIAQLQEKSWEEAGMYSDHEALNNFKALDETCFGWVDEESENKENPNDDGSGDGISMDQFYEASTTKTSIWLPSGKKCTISIASTETTGYVYLEYASGTQRKIPYDRLLGGYVLDVNGSNEKADVVVKGLYNDYKLRLVNAESYRNQDSAVNVEETSNGESAPSLDGESKSNGVGTPTSENTESN